MIVETNANLWQRMIKNRIAYIVGVLIAAFMIIGIGMSRFMLGAHSIDQVIYGWTYGIWMAFFMWRYVRPSVSVHLRRILESDLKHLSIHDQAVIRGEILKYMIFALVAWIILFVISGLIFFFTSYYFEIPEYWINAIIYCKDGV
jgi:membrane-associated phospholipid phosphatase